jgi:acyl-CoA dehydrogenase
MQNIMAAKAYETNTFAETAVRSVGNAVRLEGTAHVNMGQAVKFMHNYFNDNVDLPEVPDGKMIKDDSSAMFDQAFGGARNVKFSDYRTAFAGCELANVKIFLEQAEALKKFNNESPMSKEQQKNQDFMLNIAEIFGAVVYGQLAFEKARIEEIEGLVIDQLFSYLVRDINNFAMRQVNEYAGHFAEGQKENLQAIIREPSIDFEREESLLADYVFALDGVYGSTYGEVING